jgi:hypothetical protein
MVRDKARLRRGHNDQSRQVHKCSETTLPGESQFHTSTQLGIEPGSLMTGSKQVCLCTSGTVYECSDIAGSHSQAQYLFLCCFYSTCFCTILLVVTFFMYMTNRKLSARQSSEGISVQFCLGQGCYCYREKCSSTPVFVHCEGRGLKCKLCQANFFSPKNVVLAEVNLSRSWFGYVVGIFSSVFEFYS